MAKNNMGIKREGSKLMVLQSFMCSTPKPEAVMRIPPTSETSEMSSVEINDRERSAMP